MKAIITYHDNNEETIEGDDLEVYIGAKNTSIKAGGEYTLLSSDWFKKIRFPVEARKVPPSNKKTTHQ